MYATQRQIDYETLTHAVGLLFPADLFDNEVTVVPLTIVLFKDRFCSIIVKAFLALAQPAQAIYSQSARAILQAIVGQYNMDYINPGNRRQKLPETRVGKPEFRKIVSAFSKRSPVAFRLPD